MKEIYQVLENATDKCEDAGNVIESIIVKYAQLIKNQKLGIKNQI